MTSKVMSFLCSAIHIKLAQQEKMHVQMVQGSQLFESIACTRMMH